MPLHIATVILLVALPIENHINKINPMAIVMAKQGYVAIPMTMTDQDNVFTVPCRVGGESFRMMVDTGAQTTSLDRAIVKRLNLPLGPERQAVGVGGLVTEHEVVLPDGLQLGSFDTRQIGRGKLSVRTGDLSQLNEALARNQQAPIGGILGLGGLKQSSAIIDCSSKTLYLQTPLNKVWPQIEGRWIAVRKEERHKEPIVNSPTPVQVEFKNHQITVTDPDEGVCITYGIHMLSFPDYIYMPMYTPGDELKEPMRYVYIGVMKITNGKLTLGMSFDPERVNGEPPALRIGPGGVGILLECVRDKP